MYLATVIILAAGEGKRMKTGIPKVMNLLHDKPLVGYVVDAVKKSGLVEKPIVVVSKNHTLVQDYLGDRAEYVVQEQQLGTGHAVACAEKKIQSNPKPVVVLYGDMPFISAESICRLVEEHTAQNNLITLMTVRTPDFDGWHAQFTDFGRVVRNATGTVVKIVERKDATPEELMIHEVNTSYFCFNSRWLVNRLHQLHNNNAQGEYYLVDLVRIAFEEGVKVGTVLIDPKEAIGINTKEHLDLAEDL